MTPPVIGVMPGDATGIGPEVLAKVLAAPPGGATPRLIVFGDRRVVEMGAREAGVTLPLRDVNGPEGVDWSVPGIPFVDTADCDPTVVGRRAISAASGRATGATLERMIRHAEAGRLDGVCFAPLNKKGLWEGGWRFPDEHQMFAALLRHDGFFGEMNVIPQFSTFRVTSHVPMRRAMEMITPERITAAVRLAHASLRAQLGEERPRIGVAALNPHAGEGGLFGTEEIEVITPALDALRAEGLAVTGPVPADVIFIRALKGEFQGVVSMYHDQGQVATKLLNFNKGVTVTAGLAIPFATPAHGTAYDIAGEGRADPGAMEAALLACTRLAAARMG